MSKKGYKNLIPVTERTKEEQREIQRKGGIASGKARRQKRRLKEIADIMLEMTIGEGRLSDLENIKEITEVADKKITTADAMVFAQIQKALKGDNKSFELIRDLVGENPANQTVDDGEIAKVDELLNAMIVSVKDED